MRLQLAEPITLAITGAVTFLSSEKGRAILKNAAEIFKNMPKAEQNRFVATLNEVKISLGIATGMTQERALYVMENVPWLISQANQKMQGASTGEKRVQSRYIKAFEQILNETMDWYSKAYPAVLPAPPPPVTPSVPAPPVVPGTEPTATDFFKKNAPFIIGGIAALFLLPKLLKK